jgi:NADH:ubiquinone oxidoreductase subunit E
VTEIRICLGSSCFARGNAENLRIIQDFLAATGHSAHVTTLGHLCQDECNTGPNLILDGVMHRSVDASKLRELLAIAFPAGGRP